MNKTIEEDDKSDTVNTCNINEIKINKIDKIVKIHVRYSYDRIQNNKNNESKTR